MFSAPAPATEQLGLFTAPSTVDSPGTESVSRFASPASAARTTLGPAPTDEQQHIIDAFLTGQHLVAEAGAGTGKALRYDQPVLTPAGWRAIGDLQAGDTVVGSTGMPVYVNGVYPQGIRELYEVVVSDGTVIVADAEHLWLTTTTKERDRRKPGRVRTTAEIAATMRLRSGRINHYLPMLSGPVVMPRADLPLDPYLLGVLLGDGGLGSGTPMLSTPDLQILTLVKLTLPDGVDAVPIPGSSCDYRLTAHGATVPGRRGMVNPLVDILRDLKLLGTRSADKHIPDAYLYASVEQRGAVLRGLLDTDGSAAGVAVEFSTASKLLAEQVTWLAQGLGGFARSIERQPWYTYRGERRTGQISYRMRISLPADVEPFRLARKRDALRPRTRFQPYRQIVEIRPVPAAEAVCISVEAEDHLYLTAGCVPTHNTSTLRMLAAAAGPRRPGLYLAYNASVAKEAVSKFPRGVDCRTAHSLAYAAVGCHFAHRLPRRPGQRAGDSQAKRLPASEVAKVLGLHGERLGDRFLSGPALARVADATVTQFCRSVDVELDTRHVPAVAGMSAVESTWLARVILPAARRLWADLCSPHGVLWFTHDHYLKMWQLTDPRLPAEYILLDEAQDADPVIAAVVAAQDHAQLVYVGDRAQAIYGWRGAVDAMESFAGTRLQLTQSFRFGQPVADEANEWLDLLGADLRLTGTDRVTSTVGYVSSPRAILCRTNGGSIGAVMDQLEAGRRVALVGEGKEIKRFAWAAQSLMAGRGCDLPELAAFKTWRELVQYVEEESGRDLQVMVKIVQRYGPGTLIDTIAKLTPEARAEVTVSTAHKAKGLEWPAVRIGADFAPPLDGDKPDRAELMLAYVSVTRAQNALDVGSLSWRRTGHWFEPAYLSDLEN